MDTVPNNPENSKLNLEEILSTHQNLAYKIASTYRNRGVPLEDLKQEGLIGLVKACRNFDPQRNTQFSTYAVYWIKKQILEAIKQETNNLCKSDEYSNELAESIPAPLEPVHTNSLQLPHEMPELEKAILNLSYANGLSLKEIALRLNLTVEKVKQHKQKGLRRMKSFMQKETSGMEAIQASNPEAFS
ncbi:MAG: sigma-70 family RNA polymerase sigma factor [Candidatus Cloacimonetes bacterium]|nr:sigma-70 family RNA polymerase sigma factor [Candidatus Cloacimonadota bacterium]